METFAVQGSEQFAALTGTGPVEVALGIAITVLAVTLLVVWVRRSSAARRRKEGGAAYFDHDAAHYGPRGKNDSASGPNAATGAKPSPSPRFGANQPIAPSFSAPKRGHRTHSGSSATGPASGARPSAPARTSDVQKASAPEPVASPVASPVLAPIPSLKPKGALPSTLPAMPAPPPSTPPS